MNRLFNGKNCKTKNFPVVGQTTVYMKHDENFGKCLIHESNFVTPNMPKISYALRFSVSDSELIVHNELCQEIILNDFREAHVFEKRDGFNCLFYEYQNNLIPKTRGAPIATGEILELINEQAFPRDRILKIVLDGYVPVFEVWGSILDEHHILHGRVNVKVVEQRENKPSLNVELIGAMQAYYEKNIYTWVSFDRLQNIAKQYDLTTAPFYGMIKLSPEQIFKLMNHADALNHAAGTTIIEGYVLHAHRDQEHGMFKVKPINIMTNDVIANSQIPPERVKAEISKLLVETTPLEIARNPFEFFEEAMNYLKEDYRLTNRLERKAKQIFIEEIANVLASQPLTDEPWRLGIHPMFLGQLRRVQKK